MADYSLETPPGPPSSSNHMSFLFGCTCNQSCCVGLGKLCRFPPRDETLSWKPDPREDITDLCSRGRICTMDRRDDAKSVGQKRLCQSPPVPGSKLGAILQLTGHTPSPSLVPKNRLETFPNPKKSSCPYSESDSASCPGLQHTCTPGAKCPPQDQT